MTDVHFTDLRSTPATSIKYKENTSEKFTETYFLDNLIFFPILRRCYIDGISKFGQNWATFFPQISYFILLPKVWKKGFYLFIASTNTKMDLLSAHLWNIAEGR